MQLLQMSSLELSTAIDKELEENPFLERDEDSLDGEEPTEGQDQSENDDVDIRDDVDFEQWEKEVLESATSSTNENVGDLEELNPDESIESEIEWDDRLDHLNLGSTQDQDQLSRLENRSRPESLLAHLQEQLALSDCTEHELAIASVIFDCLNSDGYVELSDDELLADINEKVPCNLDELEDTLVLVQTFSPLGVCARNLRECLLIQVRACDTSKAQTRIALRIVRDFFDQLSGGDIGLLASALEEDELKVKAAVELIQRLNPRPASSFSNEIIEYIEPEARIVKVDGKWQVDRTVSHTPSLKISSWYSSYRQTLSNEWKESKSSQAEKDRDYVKEQHARAKLFVSGLRYRQINVMRIIDVVVKWQQDYFNQGPSAMKPLILADVANELDLHPSTVSRLTTRKYIQTPHGILELKYFFTNRVGNQPGKEHSGIAIRAWMKELIESEDRTKPLSDQKIANLLGEKNVEISRRTVAKYREAMDISSAKQRKSQLEIATSQT